MDQNRNSPLQPQELRKESKIESLFITQEKCLISLMERIGDLEKKLHPVLDPEMPERCEEKGGSTQIEAQVCAKISNHTYKINGMYDKICSILDRLVT